MLVNLMSRNDASFVSQSLRIRDDSSKNTKDSRGIDVFIHVGDITLEEGDAIDATSTSFARRRSFKPPTLMSKDTWSVFEVEPTSAFQTVEGQ